MLCGLCICLLIAYHYLTLLKFPSSFRLPPPHSHKQEQPCRDLRESYDKWSMAAVALLQAGNVKPSWVVIDPIIQNNVRTKAIKLTDFYIKNCSRTINLVTQESDNDLSV